MDGRPMDNLVADPLVEDYLRRLDLAARVLPEDRRRELVDEIAAHIAESRASGAGARRGPICAPCSIASATRAEIVAAAREGDDPLGRAGPPVPFPRSGRPSIATRSPRCSC